MPNVAIIGLGQFGQCVLESFAKRRFGVLVIDENDAKVQYARDLATKVVKADALNAELLKEVIPDGLECAVVDLGDEMERSILVTNYLYKLKVPKIIVEAVNAAHAEILTIVGATKIIFPEREAAERLAGLLAGHGTLDYFPVRGSFSIAEIPVPKSWIGKPLMDLDLRRKHRINVIATRKAAVPGADERWRLTAPQREFEPDEIVLLAGDAKDVDRLGA